MIFELGLFAWLYKSDSSKQEKNDSEKQEDDLNDPTAENKKQLPCSKLLPKFCAEVVYLTCYLGILFLLILCIIYT